MSMCMHIRLWERSGSSHAWIWILSDRELTKYGEEARATLQTNRGFTWSPLISKFKQLKHFQQLDIQKTVISINLLLVASEPAEYKTITGPATLVRLFAAGSFYWASQVNSHPISAVQTSPTLATVGSSPVNLHIVTHCLAFYSSFLKMAGLTDPMLWKQ